MSNRYARAFRTTEPVPLHVQPREDDDTPVTRAELLLAMRALSEATEAELADLRAEVATLREGRIVASAAVVAQPVRPSWWRVLLAAVFGS